MNVALACALGCVARAQAAGDPAVITTSAATKATTATAAAVEEGVDASVEPGDDFFAYANGGWLKATQIPAGRGKWSAATELAERTRQQVAALLDEASTAPRGSDARKAADFRAAWLNDAAIEARGLAPLKPMLDDIDHLRDKAGLTRLLGRELRSDVDPMNQGVYDSTHVLGLAVQAGNHGEKDNVAYLLQGGLGMPDRDHYLVGDPRMQEQRVRYQAAIGRVLARLDRERGGAASKIEVRAEAVMALETAIARSHATAEMSADEHNAGRLWTRADFARQAPGMDWRAYFAAAGLARQQSFVAWQPTALQGLAALVASQPLRAWKDYLRIRVIGRYAEVLPQAFRADALTVHGQPAGAEQPGARAQRAFEATRSAMGETLGKIYVERHLPPEAKARLQGIVANVIAAISRRVEAAAWMSPDARSVALAKLRVLYFGIGYPERWHDDSDLVIDPADAVGNLARIELQNYRQALARLGQRVDPTDWYVSPQWPGAVLTFHQNAYNFAAALLQPPKFDASASDATNYGAIGAIVGHEVSHFVDTLGAEYAVDGSLHRWWTVDDMTQYESVTEPLVRQFSGYRPFLDVAVDGKQALTENVADLGGLAAAFDAYRGTLGSKADDKEDVRAQDRQFFIGFARAWRARYRDEALKAQAATDHAPENFRVSTVRNLDAWYDAFDVKPGQRLYLEPAARVKVW